MTGQFKKQPLKSHSGFVTAALGIPSRDLAARVNNRLTEFIDHFNKYVLAVHETFSRYNIEHEELDAAVTEMRQALEELQSGEQSYQQATASNGYLEQMFFRMYNDLARLIDERFAEYGFTQHAERSDTPLPLPSLPVEESLRIEHENRNRNIIPQNRNTVTDRNRKTVTVTQEMRIIIQQNYRKVSNAEIADACGCSLSTIEKAIHQLKQEGQLQ